MSYTKTVGNMEIQIVCKADPQTNYKKYYNIIEEKIKADNYSPKTTMDNLITMIILSFDCDDNYGKYDPETGYGGYGNKFTIEECFRYIEESGGWEEFDYYC